MTIREGLIVLLILTIALLCYKYKQLENQQKTIHEDYQDVQYTLDSIHDHEKKTLLYIIHTKEIAIDSLQRIRKTNNKKLYEKYTFFDTVPVYYIDSFLAREYDSLARFRFHTP